MIEENHLYYSYGESVDKWDGPFCMCGVLSFILTIIL